MSSSSLDHEIVLVTGASRGIGQAIARELASRGARVVGTATSERGVTTIQAALAEFGDRILPLQVDVTDEAATTAALEMIKSTWGSLPSVLVNNAGITRDNLMLRMKADEWDAVLATNLTAVQRLCQKLLRPMSKARHGRIINISSVVGVTGNAGQCNYAAAKAGLIGFSYSLAREVASRNITVNVVAPGLIRTDMTASLPREQQDELLAQVPLGRFGLPEDIACAVAFLASEEAAYITGTTLHVNGGMFMG